MPQGGRRRAPDRDRSGFHQGISDEAGCVNERYRGMDMSNPYRGFRLPAEIIGKTVWLFRCFSLSLREVELILAVRTAHETVQVR